MRVLYVHHRPETGGAPMSLLLLMREIRQYEDVSIRVLSPPGPAAKMFQNVGLDVHTIPISSFVHNPGSQYRGARWLMLLKEGGLLPFHLHALSREMAQFQPDIVHLNDIVLIAAAALVHYKGTKLVWHVRGVLDRGHFGLRRNVVRTLLRHYADRIIAIDQDVRSELELRDGVEVIHNAMMWKQFDNHLSPQMAKRALGIDPANLVVSIVARFYRVKGSYDFIHAAYQVKQQVPHVKFVMVGGAVRPAAYFQTWKGRLLTRLRILEDSESIVRGLIRQYGMEEDFILLDFVDDIEKVYRASDVASFPSHLRGISRSALEAAAFGIPMVATTVHWNDDVVVHGKTGILVPQHDIQAIADATVKLLKDEQMRQVYGVNARRHAEENFDPKKNAERVYQLYRKLLQMANQ